jgi:hypothetical protein
MNSRTRRQVEIQNLNCGPRHKIHAEMDYEQRQYMLDVTLFPMDTRASGGIRQIVATAKDHFGSNRNLALNLVYNSDGTQAPSMAGEDPKWRAAVRMIAIRAVNFCATSSEQ